MPSSEPVPYSVPIGIFLKSLGKKLRAGSRPILNEEEALWEVLQSNAATTVTDKRRVENNMFVEGSCKYVDT